MGNDLKSDYIDEPFLNFCYNDSGNQIVPDVRPLPPLTVATGFGKILNSNTENISWDEISLWPSNSGNDQMN